MARRGSWFMLEYWYKDKRTLVDFRRGPLGPHLDGFAAYLQARGYGHHCGQELWSKCCQFNAFLLDQRLARCAHLSESRVDAFLQAYFAHTPTGGGGDGPRHRARRACKHLFDYLIQIKAWAPPKPKRISKPYGWLLIPYTRYLRVECQLSERSIRRFSHQVGAWLEALGRRVQRKRFNALKAQTVERFVKQLLRTSTDPAGVTATLRRFPFFCARQRSTPTDFSGLVPPIRRYRHASLPKGG